MLGELRLHSFGLPVRSKWVLLVQFLGREPSKSLCDRFIEHRAGRCPHRLGTMPVKPLLERSRVVKLLKFAISAAGNDPDNPC